METIGTRQNLQAMEQLSPQEPRGQAWGRLPLTALAGASLDFRLPASRLRDDTFLLREP